ncbi:MAG: hypothetical protein AB1489_37050 [Acidobacteriota bacterium]
MTSKKPEQEVAFVQKPAYSKRNRKLEWRHNWFHLYRVGDDRELHRIIDKALDLKKEKIKGQRETANHLAGYAPAGAGTPWFCIGPRNVNGRVKSIAVHPTNENIVYAGAASGGIWKSEDGGQSWRPLWDEQESLAIGSIAIAPSAVNTIYVGTGEWTPGWSPSYPGAGIYVSTDAGVTWTQRAAVLARRIARILVSPTDSLCVYVAGETGFERSLDGGLSWTTIKTGQISDAVINPSNANILYINVRDDGIYKSTDGGVNWSKLTNGPTSTNANWVKLAIGISGTHGSNYLVAKNAGTIYKSIDGGSTWSTIAGSHGDASFHQWCSMIAVAPDNEDIILAGGVGSERTSNGGTNWSALAGLHSDHHVAIFAPSNTNTVYECNDGGVYRSNDKGVTWKKASHGLVVTQFYDVGSWDTISNVIGGGTQDQGTNMTTGGLTWRNIFGWDGGYFVVNPNDPRTIYAEHQYTDIHKSTDGGNTWVNKTAGLSDGTPWVGVITMDHNNPNTLFVGTTRVFRTTDGCATPWQVSSQLLGASVSSIVIAPSDSNRVYAGAGGKVFRSDDGGATSPWTEKTGTLPNTRPVTDIAVDRTQPNRLAVCYGGINSSGTANHVFISSNGGDSWTDISGNLPNINVNAVALDPNDTNTIYIGTDAGVYRTTDLGVNWEAFDNGIPNVIISDLHIDPEDNIIYAATFGRGMYKLSIAPAVVEPSVDLYLRDSILDTGERFPSPSNQPNPNDIGDQVYWWESPDIKVDVAPYYTSDAVFDGVEFDEELAHEDPIRNEVNRFYLQVHNRGWQATTNVRVRAFFADAHAGLPALPNALVPPDFNLTSTANWQPIGPAQTIPVLEPNRPAIISWDWTVPVGANNHSCLLAVVSSGDDPIITTETNVNNLIKSEKRVCLKNLHVINSPGPRPEQTLVTMKFHNAKTVDDLIDIVIMPIDFSEGTLGMLLQPVEFANQQEALHNVTIYRLQESEDIGSWYERPGNKMKVDRSELLQKLDRSQLYEFDSTKTSELRGVKIGAQQTIQAVITCKGSHKVPYGLTQKFAVMQRQDGEIVGGSTYEIRLKRAKALLPVSRIRVMLDKVRILNDHDPWIKGAGEFHFLACISFNNDPYRRHWYRVPLKGNLRIDDWPGSNERLLNVCIFDGYVAEKDNMSISLLPIEEDWLDPNDELSLYCRRFNGPPETWVGHYGPGDEPASSDVEKLSDWLLWYRIESVKL